MAKKLYLTFLLICLCLSGLWAKTSGIFYKDELIGILKLQDKDSVERKLTYFFKDYFQNAPLSDISINIKICDSLLDKYNIDNKESYKYFIESMGQGRKNNLEADENAIVKAIKQINNNTDHFLLYIFLNHLAVVQTDEGNTTGAIFSYWKAKKEVEKMNDLRLEASLNINISDLYYKNDIYNQSLFYLDKAEAIINEHHLIEPHFLTIIYYNKAEIFFRTNKPDSLKVYNQKLQSPGNVSTRIFDYRKRTDYYSQLLNHNYKYAIKLIKLMQADKLYKYSVLEKQRLADAYFDNGQTDSAKQIIGQLLKEPLEANNPEIKFHLYEELATIAGNNKNAEAAIDNYKLSLNEIKNYIAKFAQIRDVSSQMKIDEIESSYIQRDEGYKREQLILVFVLVVATLLLIVFIMFYRNIKQKRHYENLLHKAEKHELAFINSHEVRRHLSNILGILDLIKQSDKQEDTFAETREHLYNSVQHLDEAIKSISEKLDG